MFRTNLLKGKALRKLLKKQPMVKKCKSASKEEDASRDHEPGQRSMLRRDPAAVGNGEQKERPSLLNMLIHLPCTRTPYFKQGVNSMPSSKLIVHQSRNERVGFSFLLQFLVKRLPPVQLAKNARKEVKREQKLQKESSARIMLKVQRVLEHEMTKRDVLKMVRHFTSDEPLVEYLKHYKEPVKRMSLTFEQLSSRLRKKFNPTSLVEYFKETESLRSAEMLSILIKEEISGRFQPKQRLVFQISDIALHSIQNHICGKMTVDDVNRFFRYFKDDEHFLAVIGDKGEHPEERLHAVFQELKKLGFRAFNPTVVVCTLQNLGRHRLEDEVEVALRPKALLRQTMRQHG